jgi:hypothetical protein
MEESGYGHLLGSGSFASDVGLYEEIAASPEILWVQDEFHDFITRLSMQQAPTYVKGIERILLEGFSGSISGRSLKGSKSEAIKNPYPCLFALSQPETFWRGYTNRLADSGFMGRFIIFKGREALRTKYDTDKFKAPPTTLIDTLTNARSEWSSLLAQRSGSAGERVAIAHDARCELRHRKMISDVDDMAMAEHAKGNKVKAQLLARMNEKMNKLALVHAWSMCPSNPVMTVDSIEWGYNIILKATEMMFADMQTNVSENHVEDAAKRLLTVIEAAGVTGLSSDELYSKTRYLRKRERDEMLDDLASVGKIRKITNKDTGGRPKVTVVSTKY